MSLLDLDMRPVSIGISIVAAWSFMLLLDPAYPVVTLGSFFNQ